MNEQDYMEFVVNNYAEVGTKDAFIISALGLAGEAGETVDVIKKGLFHRDHNAIDREKLILEMGDVLNYLTYMCANAGITLDTLRTTNYDKLVTRYEQQPDRRWHNGLNSNNSPSGPSAGREQGKTGTW